MTGFRIKPMRYPVRGRGAWSIETVAWFFDYYAAVRFVNESPRTLYIGEPDYDDRDRFLDAEQLVEVEHLAPRDGKHRIAA